MHEAAFSEAAKPSQWEVLKLPMFRYSIGHEIELHRVKSPFVIGGPLTREKLIEAVLICHHSQAQLDKPDRLFRFKCKVWGWRIRKENIQLAIADFQNYRAAGSSEPPTDEMPCQGQPERPPGAPFVLRLLQFVMFKMGKSEAEAADYPLGLAKWHYAAYYEGEKGIKIKNAHDYEFERFCAEQDAKEAERLAKEGK